MPSFIVAWEKERPRSECRTQHTYSINAKKKMEYLRCTHYSWVSWHSSLFFSHSLFALALLVCSRASINRCIFMWIVCNCNVDAVCMRQTSRDRYDEKYSKNSLVPSTDDASNIVECQRFGIFSTSSSSSCCNFFLFSLLLMRKRSEEKISSI